MNLEIREYHPSDITSNRECDNKKSFTKLRNYEHSIIMEMRLKNFLQIFFVFSNINKLNSILNFNRTKENLQ